MTRPRPFNRPARLGRLGFTLVELLAVIVIIAILLGLLIPAVMAAVRTARAAAVGAEINQMAQALADFKSKMGDYPPSRVLLYETGYMPTSSTTVVPSGGINSYNDITEGTLALRTLTAFRKFWPRTQFSTTGAYWSPPLGQTQYTTWYDYNGTGGTGPDSNNTPYVLQGNECLTFFLGGIPLQPSSGGSYSMTGFAKDPANPFRNSIVGNTMYSANRNPVFFEFDSARLVLTANALQTAAPIYGNGLNHSFIPGYLDSLGSQGVPSPQPPVATAQSGAQNFYAYFSSNVGSGYDPNDVNFTEDDISGNPGPIMLQFFTLLPVNSTTANTVYSASPNPYTTVATMGGANIAYVNSQSFQIISAGADGSFGVGGWYSPNDPSTTLPAQAVTSNAGTNNDPSVRQIEGDNLTNFHNGKLN